MKTSQKNKPILTQITFNDGRGGQHIIRTPVLLSIFQSEKLEQLYNKDPDRKYSVKELLELCDTRIPIKESTIRSCMRMRMDIFEKTETAIDIRKRGVVVINLAKLNPVARHIFDAVKRIKENQNEK